MGGESDGESLTSLLNEIVFLNQQTASTQQQDDHGPWLLQLDSDSDESITREMEEAGLNEPLHGAQGRLLPGAANGNTTDGAQAPPPLLQMKVGGSKVGDPASRPMPRLVPLGLRGNQPS